MPEHSAEDLRQLLVELDGKGYPAYKRLRGTYRFDRFSLKIDRVQGDPFASPTRVRTLVSLSQSGFPLTLIENTSRRVALCDYLTREFVVTSRKVERKRGSGRSGEIRMSEPGQEILPRTSFCVRTQLEARFTVGLPARGRRIDSRQAATLLLDDLPGIVEEVMFAHAHDMRSIEAHADVNEDQNAARDLLRASGLVAFVADGAFLPRRAGNDDRPMSKGEVVPFESPDSLRTEITLPYAGAVQGMGIPEGLTLIVGGGYHGKSTLLKAIEKSVYNHIPGDGRERVVTSARAVKIRSEEGREISGVDLRPFVSALPLGRETDCFSTTDASGSTSQAANVIEAIEAGADTLLIDEDTSATNFMSIDSRMRALVATEPITPYVDRVRSLYEDVGVSTVLIAGSSGDFFDVADLVIRMETYGASDVTSEAKEAGGRMRELSPTDGVVFGRLSKRRIGGWPARGQDRIRLRNRQVEVDGITVEADSIEQIVGSDQLRAIGYYLRWIRRATIETPCTVKELLRQVEEASLTGELDEIAGELRGDFVQPRLLDIVAAVNRIRGLQVSDVA